MLRAFRCDLHIHTCLSPCADLDMYPSALIEKSIAEKLDVIAVCDHHASENVEYVLTLAKGRPITVLPGMEVSSLEEVHVLAIFDDLHALLKLQTTVYEHLPGKNREDIFGPQVIVNDRDEVEGMNERLLIGATDMPLNRIVNEIHALGGIAIASHIDRPSYSVLSQLGFIDPETPFDALEISAATCIKEARRQYPELSAHAMIQFSDAHFIRDIGRGFSTMILKTANIHELKLAFEKRDGRYIEEDD
ncbi:MAG: histidinol phosphatase [Deltaproteobacteria bacterium HGW-Deltaproteobacteria-11]|nr:MAG: histidinol phosphatase [Deltaproteobacteria bacterium HGW-Deltaproteobacteria-11]